MDKVQALHSFWSSFGIKAYDEGSIPDEMSFTNEKNKTKPPYISYEAVVGDFGDDIASSASVWYYGDSWKPIENKMAEIDERLNDGGVTIGYDGGNIWIKKASPYRSRIVDSNDMVRRYLINVMIEYH